jgi:hypothetical protein
MDHILSDGMGSCTLHCDIFCAVVRLHTTVTVVGSCRSGRASREVPEAGHTAIVLQHQWYHEVSIAAKVQTLCRYADSCVLQHHPRSRHIRPANVHCLEAADATRAKDCFMCSSLRRDGRSCSWLYTLLLRALPFQRDRYLVLYGRLVELVQHRDLRSYFHPPLTSCVHRLTKHPHSHNL